MELSISTAEGCPTISSRAYRDGLLEAAQVIATEPVSVVPNITDFPEIRFHAQAPSSEAIDRFVERLLEFSRKAEVSLTVIASPDETERTPIARQLSHPLPCDGHVVHVAPSEERSVRAFFRFVLAVT
jgi:hypothetical protein